MSAVTALLLIFIFAINITTLVTTLNQSKQMLNAVYGRNIQLDGGSMQKPANGSDPIGEKDVSEPADADNLPTPPDFDYAPTDNDQTEIQSTTQADDAEDDTELDDAADEADDAADDDTTDTTHTLPKQSHMFGISEDDAVSARFFRVIINSDNEPVAADVDKISSVTSDEAKEYAAAVLKTGKSSGHYGHFLYKLSDDNKSESGRFITFLDISSDINDILKVLVITFSAGILCWLLMLFIMSKLSFRAIKPYAENMEKQKQFVTDAGHEIKTPLAVIRANAEAMELYNGESKWSKNIKAQVDRMTGLMQELLELARTEQSEIKPVLEKIELSELSQKMADSFNELAVSSGKHIATGIEGGVCVNSNKKLIERVLDVLLDNAIKYSTDDSEIKFSLSKDKKSPEIRIENLCNPLPDCEPEKLFDRFYRSDSSRNSSGYGIGLASAKAAAEAIGGRLTAEFKSGNKIVFIFRLTDR